MGSVIFHQYEPSTVSGGSAIGIGLARRFHLSADLSALDYELKLGRGNARRRLKNFGVFGNLFENL